MDNTVLQTRPPILLLGKTGCGKSTLANFLSGIPLREAKENRRENLFGIGKELHSLTKDFQVVPCYLGGDQNEPILIIDSPGLEDNGGLKNSDIFIKLFNFIQEKKLHNAMIIYCFNGLNKPNDNDFAGFNNFQNFLGKKVMKNNAYVLITQLNRLSQDDLKDQISIFKRDLPKMLQKKFEEFDESHLIVSSSPDEIFSFIKSITNQSFSEIPMKPIDPNALGADNQQFKTILSLLKTEALEELKQFNLEEYKNDKEKEESRNYKEEIVLSIDIIQCKVYNDLSSILSSLENSDSLFYQLILEYFTFKRSLDKELTLINDIYRILTEIDKRDEEIRFKKDNYEKYLFEEFNLKINKALIYSLDMIIQIGSLDLKKHKMKATGVLSQGLHFESKTIKPLLASLSALGVSTFGRLAWAALSAGAGAGAGGAGTGIGAGIAIKSAETVATAEAATAGGVAGSLALTTLGLGAAVGLVGWGLWTISWKRGACIQELCSKIHKSLLDKSNKEAANGLKKLLEVSCTHYLLSLLNLADDS